MSCAGITPTLVADIQPSLRDARCFSLTVPRLKAWLLSNLPPGEGRQTAFALSLREDRKCPDAKRRTRPRRSFRARLSPSPRRSAVATMLRGMKRLRILLLLALAAIVAVGLVLFWPRGPKEPVWCDVPISQWITEAE